MTKESKGREYIDNNHPSDNPIDEYDDPCPMDEFECDVCGLRTTEPEGYHHCYPRNSDD